MGYNPINKFQSNPGVIEMSRGLKKVGNVIRNTAKGAGEELSYLKGKGLRGAVKDVYDNTIGGDPTFKRMAKGDIFNTGLKNPLGSFKKGGKVKKTGVYKLHKGEEVINAKEVMGKALANKIKR